MYVKLGLLLILGDDCKVCYAWQKLVLQQAFKDAFGGATVYVPCESGGTVRANSEHIVGIFYQS